MADGPRFRYVLERPELGSSCRVTRRFGSKALLRIKLSSNIINKFSKYLLPLFQRPVVLCGRVYRAFYAKDSTVFFILTAEQFDGCHVTPLPSVITPSPTVLPFLDFLHWHNPIEFNSKQTMAKWSARFALLLSTSVPALRLENSNIKYIDDIVSTTGSDMTDGCGFANHAALKSMTQHLGWDGVPTAVQHRLFGTKGLFIISPDSAENALDAPIVLLRPSQKKINHDPSKIPDPALLIVDAIRQSHLRTPSRISAQTITNLAENGVPHEVFVKLLKSGLQNLVTCLLNWDGPDAMLNLWFNVARTGGVFSARLARESCGEARAHGYSEHDGDDNDLEAEDDLEISKAFAQRSKAWWADQISGCPSSLEETIMVLLDSGFDPRMCPVLRDKLLQVVKTTIKSYVVRYKIDVPMSGTAFLVPDPLGKLGPYEIYIKSSHKNILMPDGLYTDVLTGDVLLTRYPCMLPTDILKFKAVDASELGAYTDVIVCSIQMHRRLADLLAGGDYDGDKGLWIHQPEIVSAFTNADLQYLQPPSDIDLNFSQEVETVSEFLTRISKKPPSEQIHPLQAVLLGSIRDITVIGKYSGYHEAATYKLGYKHPETIRLAYVFCKALDGSKTGLTVHPEQMRKDAINYSGKPRWKQTEDDRENLKINMSNGVVLKRVASGKFVMDIMQEQAKIEGNLQLAEVQQQFEWTARPLPDPHLTQPWFDAQKIARRWILEENCHRHAHDLAKIEKHVEEMYGKHRQELSLKGKSRKGGAAFTDQSIEVRQDKFRALSKEFADSPPPYSLLMDERQIARLRASYAYLYDAQQSSKGWTRFPWDVAMRELCDIKARALGPSKTSTADFYERYSIKQSSLRQS